MKISKVALIGAGAVGAYCIHKLQDSMGDDFCVLAEGERKERLSQGININGQLQKLNVKGFDEAGEVDLLLVATKYGAFRQAVESARLVVGKHTVIMSLLNGIDSERIAAEIYGEEHVLPAFIKIVSARRPEGIFFDPAFKAVICYGEADGSQSERVLAVKALFDQYQVGNVLAEDIISDQWNKFAMNLVNNLLQAVLGVGYGAYFDSKHVMYLHQKITSEVFSVAAAEGIKLTVIPTPRKVSHPSARFSTLQDLDAKRPTETDMFLKVFLGIAAKHNIQVPYCDYTYHALKSLEEKNTGMFDY